MTMPKLLAQDWSMGGQNLNNWRNQSTTGITSQNVGGLKTRWVFPTQGGVVTTPAVANGLVYFADLGGNFYAVNGTTGVQVWTQQIQYWTGISGDYSRNDPVIYNNMVLLGDQGGKLATWNGSTGQLIGPGARVMAVDIATGTLIWATQVEAFASAVITGSPIVYNNVVYVGVASAEESLAATQGFPCCVSRGSLVALNAQTGQKIWQTYMVPDNSGLLGGYSGGAVWSTTPVIDPKRNSIYVGTGNNYSVPAAVKACIQANPGNKNCTDPTDYFDSVMALDLNTGQIKWAYRALSYDAWNDACLFNAAGVGNCPSPEGSDYDFGGSGPNLFTVQNTVQKKSGSHDVLGIGEKSGIYWALNPDTGSILWNTQVGPGSGLGGIEWGTATDGIRVYVPIANWYIITYALQSNGAKVNGGSWAALDPAAGRFLWQTATPGKCSTAVPNVAQGCAALGPVSVANGVVFGGSMDTNTANPTMFALDAKSGKILWSFVPGSSVNAGPAIVGNYVYWGSGSSNTGSFKLFAFSIN
jgi:polyvinyl alcohol dehydrogenase (cytochrome)